MEVHPRSCKRSFVIYRFLDETIEGAPDGNMIEFQCTGNIELNPHNAVTNFVQSSSAQIFEKLINPIILVFIG